MKILISGYYGFGNTGDELILDFIIKEFKSKEKNIIITVLSADPQKTKTTHNVHSINRWNFFKIIFAIIKSDRIILGGGGLFQDISSFFGIYYYIGIIFLSKLFLKKVFIYAVSINELKFVNRIFAIMALKLSDKITIRDYFSYNLISKWGLPEYKIEITADPVFCKNLIFKNFNQDKPNIAFIPRFLTKNNIKPEIYANISESLIKKISANIIFIPFHVHKDVDYINQINKLTGYNSKVLKWNNVTDIVDAFGMFDIVITQRLHGLILAALYSIPSISISNDSKLKEFAKEINQKSVDISHDINPSYIENVVFDVWQKRIEFQDSIKKLIPSIINRSKITSDLFFSL